MLCVLIRIASMRSFWLEHTACLHVEESRKDGLSISLGIVPWLALVGSRCPWHGHFFPWFLRVFGPFGFGCL